MGKEVIGSDFGTGIRDHLRPRRITAEQHFLDMVGVIDDLSHGLVQGEDAITAARARVTHLAASVRESVEEHPGDQPNLARTYGAIAVDNRGIALSAYHALLGGSRDNMRSVRWMIGKPVHRRT